MSTRISIRPHFLNKIVEISRLLPNLPQDKINSGSAHYWPHRFLSKGDVCSCLFHPPDSSSDTLGKRPLFALFPTARLHGTKKKKLTKTRNRGPRHEACQCLQAQKVPRLSLSNYQKINRLPFPSHPRTRRHRGFTCQPCL